MKRAYLVILSAKPIRYLNYLLTRNMSFRIMRFVMRMMLNKIGRLTIMIVALIALNCLAGGIGSGDPEQGQQGNDSSEASKRGGLGDGPGD